MWLENEFQSRSALQGKYCSQRLYRNIFINILQLSHLEMNSLNFFHSFTVEVLITGNAKIIFCCCTCDCRSDVLLQRQVIGKQNAGFSCRTDITSLEIFFYSFEVHVFIFQCANLSMNECGLPVSNLLYICRNHVLVWHKTG